MITLEPIEGTIEETPTLVEALIARPGDTILIRIPPGNDPDFVYRLAPELKKHLPEGVNVVLVLADQMIQVIPGTTDD